MIDANKVALVLVTLNAEKYWADWINGFNKQTFKPKFRLVIDSSSSDNTVKLANNADFMVKVIDKNEFNHGATRQLAMQMLPDAKFIIYMTQDAIINDDKSLEILISSFSDPRVGAVFGRQIPRINSNAIEAHARLFNYPQQSIVKTKDDISAFGIKTVFISNSFAAYNKDLLTHIKGFPANVILGEDTYVAAKMILNGWKVAYNAEAKVLHSHNYNFFQEFSRYFDTGVFHASQPWIRQQFGKAEGEGKRFVLSEINYLIKNNFLLIPSSIIRTAMKLIGFRLGCSENKLPFRIKKKLSMNKSYWSNQ